MAKQRTVWRTTLLASAGLLALAVAGPSRRAAGRLSGKGLSSKVVSWAAAKTYRADWGEFRRFFAGETLGTEHVLVAAAVVQPGKAVHKAHRHADEEYLYVAEGEGTWYLAGKQFPAKKGDMLYVEPWVYHGLTNTGTKPLVFVVFRYRSKGVPTPRRPDDRPDELKAVSRP